MSLQERVVAQIQRPVDQYARLIEGHRVSDILGIPTYEGTIQLRRRMRGGATYNHQVKARVLVGSDVPLPAFYSVGNNQQPDVFSTLFFDAVSRLTGGWVAYLEETGPIPAFDTILAHSGRHPNLPVSVVYAHGFTRDNQHFIEASKGRDVPFQEVISVLKQRDSVGLNKEAHPTVLLVSCNAKGLAISGDAVIVYKSGIVGTFGATGEVLVSQPKQE